MTTTPEDRLRALAREAALENHLAAMTMGLTGHSEGIYREDDRDLGFATCPHPDCVLVRASDPSVPPSAIRDVIGEMRTIQLVAGQCSVEGLRDSTAIMAGAESERVSRWADALECALSALPSVPRGKDEPPKEFTTAKERHLWDLYQVLGVPWGDDIFASIEQLKADASARGSVPHWQPIEIAPSRENEPSPSPAPEQAQYRIWVAYCPFKKNGFPVLGTFGASESAVVIFKMETWKRLCADVPKLQTTQFEVGSQE